MITSVDKLLAQRIAWLESLQRERQEHLDRIIEIMHKKQLEIDNLKQINSRTTGE